VTAEIDSACAIKSGVNRYTYRADWSRHHEEYVGSCIELPSLSRRAPTPREAIGDTEVAVDQFVADLQACGETPPTPLTARSYSGTFVVRTSPELHGRLALVAAEQRVSMNQWVVQKLSGRKIDSGFETSGFD
jgi:predicted HicB family RNase H-like nuclease